MSIDKSELILGQANLGQANPGQQNTADRIVMPEREPGARRGGRFILFAGVAGACVLGVGAGLWARPAMNERRMAAQVPKADATARAPAARQLRIVVDARPPPVGPPIEVLPKGEAPPVREAAREAAGPMQVLLPPSEPQAPRPAQEGLMRILAPAFALAAETLAHPHAATAARSVQEAEPEPAPKPLAAPTPIIAKAAPRRTEAIRLAQAEARAEHKAELRTQNQAGAEHKAELARAEGAKASAHRIELAKAAAHRIELARAAKTAKQEQVRLAEAEAHGRAEAREAARQERLAQAQHAKMTQLHLASLMRTLAHALPHRTKPEPPPILTARLGRRHGHNGIGAHKGEPRVEQASLKSHKGHAAPKLTQASHPARPRPEPVAPPAHPSGLMRVSTRCASRDPGEAIVCADPNLGAADRQLTRAYQGARAAGVPDSQLRQQQQHWLAARSSAAREAPWAVRDVYLARIAELNGQAREAHGEGY